MYQGQRKGGGRPLIGRAGHAQRAAMSYGNAPHNGESQARTSCLTGAGFVHSIEAFAQMWQILSSNADPRVADLQESLPLFRSRAHRDMTAMAIIFDGIVEQREYRLFEQCRIANHQCCFVGFYLNADLSLLCQGLYATRSRVCYILEVHHLVLLVRRTVVQAGKRQQVGRQRPHMVRFRNDIL